MPVPHHSRFFYKPDAADAQPTVKALKALLGSD